MIKYQLSVDAGATKTAFALYECIDEQWYKRDSFILGPASLVQQGEEAFQIILQGIHQCISTRRLQRHEIVIAIGAAGAGNDMLKRQLESKLKDYDHTIVTTDAHISCLGANLGQPINVVAIGTGSVAMSLGEDNNIQQYGGWGFPIADMGGGAWIGQQAVRCLIDATETQKSSPLSQHMAKEISQERSDILGWIKYANSAEYASFVPAIIQLASQGCENSQTILNDGLQHVLDLTQRCASQNNLHIAFLGSLGAYYYETLKTQNNPWCERLVDQKGDALDGAHMLALQYIGRAL